MGNAIALYIVLLIVVCCVVVGAIAWAIGKFL